MHFNYKCFYYAFNTYQVTKKYFNFNDSLMIKIYTYVYIIFFMYTIIV